jgi:hypothetical protein
VPARVRLNRAPRLVASRRLVPGYAREIQPGNSTLQLLLRCSNSPHQVFRSGV